MKNLLIIIVTLFFSYAASANDEVEVIHISPDGDTISYISSSEEGEALHCKNECADGNTYSCWLCKCSDLQKCGKEEEKEEAKEIRSASEDRLTE